MRNSNIELLRIISIIGVIVLHFNTIGGGFDSVSQYSLKWLFLTVLECVFISAVNIFILITGYYMSNTYNVKCCKPIKLLFQVLIFNVGMYFASIFFGVANFSLKGLLVSFLPQNYFVVLYCVVYLFIPYINCLIEQLENNTFNNLIKMLVIVFSVWAFVADFIVIVANENLIGISTVSAYGSQYGYTIIHFFVMYLMGAYIKKCKCYNKNIYRNIYTIIICWLILVCMAYIFSLCELDTGVLYSYCNPIIVLCSINIFKLFISLKHKNNKLINALSRGAFTVFIIHGSLLVFVKQYTSIWSEKNEIYFAIYIVMLCGTAYIIGWIMHWIYEKVERKLFSTIFSKIACYEICCKKRD